VSYEEFLRSKAVVAPERGMQVAADQMNPNLKPHARDIAAWMIRGGNRACFASFGLHKTSIQLQVAHTILQAVKGSGLIVCPLGVRREFIKEAGARGFSEVPIYVRNNEEHERGMAEGHRLFLTNYERVRDGALDPNSFTVASLDEAAILRSFGSKTYQEFLPLFGKVPFKFVATATPSPNRLKELIHYAGFLGVMDTGQALTRFFKRDSTSAGNLTLHPHKEREFWLWVSTWAVFITKPSDLGHSDTGYILPALKIEKHRLPVDHLSAGYDSWGQGKLLRNAATSLSDSAREKRDSLGARVERCRQIIEAAGPDRHWIIWHELEDERRALEQAIPGIVTICGSMDMERREEIVADFAEGRERIFGTKPSLSGVGSNFQHHCYSSIFLDVGYKFHDFIQAVYRTQRFGQTHECELHLIYTESEDPIYETLMQKWASHEELQGTMTAIIKDCGLTHASALAQMQRSIGIERKEVKGELFTAVNNDNVAEMDRLEDNSVGLVVTSWPFSDHYEYTESYNDFGHNDGDKGFFAQMEHLTPKIMRALAPGRLYCVHAKDRIVYGSVSGDGMYTVNRFSDKCCDHLEKQGFRFCGRITVVTDVVRENNQTYRLGWTENSKDGTKMGVGSPEYILLFRKLPSDTKNAYADIPVEKSKEDYTRARWQFDAHSFWRDRGDRFLTPNEIADMPMDQMRLLWQNYSRSHTYDFKAHVAIAQELEKRGILPSSFMALDTTNPGAAYVWDDIPRMRTLNTEQGRKGWEQHVCPLQLSIVERLIERYSNPSDLVLDPFGGLMTVPYCAVKMDRRGYGIELNEQYWKDGVSYCKSAEQQVKTPSLFDLLEGAT